MFEFQITCLEKETKIAQFILSELKKAIKGFNVVLTTYAQNKKNSIVVACEEVERPRLMFIISDVIAEAITIFYKIEYIENNLKVPIKDGLNLNAFKKALVAFDRETDKYIICREISIDKEIFLNSFYQFRLGKLRNKWQEIIKLANDNATYLLCSETFVDLLKFLIDNIEISRAVINVVKENEQYVLCDEQFNKIEKNQCPLNQIEDAAGEDINLIAALIALSPKRINVYCTTFENSPVLTLMSQIFEKRIAILPAKER